MILSSGYAEQDVVSQFAGMGLNGFIQKPYTVDNLQTTLSQVMSIVKSEGARAMMAEPMLGTAFVLEGKTRPSI